MVKVLSINVNGIRASARKGLFEWLAEQSVDVICLQETRAPLELLESDAFSLPGYHSAFHVAEKAGYSGVGIYSREKPKRVTRGLGFSSADQEGRFIQFDFDRFSVGSIYFPSGSSGEHRQEVKEGFLSSLWPILQKWSRRRKPFILCGDFNIVHREIDIRNFKQNQKSSGCLPHEREWFDRMLSELGLVDAFRVVQPDPDHYTWWSNRGRAWDNNVGWRIDYQVVTKGLKESVQAASIYKDQRFSDHAPLLVEYDPGAVLGV